MLLTEQMATYDTRLPREVSAEALAALDAYAELVGRAERAYCARYSRGDKVNKKAFMAEFGLNGRQFNAIERHIKGLAQSQASNRANYIDDDRARLEKNQETLEALCKALDKANAAGDQAGAGKLLGKINGKLAYGWKVSDRLAQRQADADAGRVTLCLGGRQLFAKQFNLAANGYASHAAWLADWRDSRRNHILCVGCQSEPWGNRNAQLMPDGPDTFTLRLNLPPALHARFGKTLTLRGLRFARPGALERMPSSGSVSCEK